MFNAHVANQNNWPSLLAPKSEPKLLKGSNILTVIVLMESEKMSRQTKSKK
jgi:hypothetical protein